MRGASYEAMFPLCVESRMRLSSHICVESRMRLCSHIYVESRLITRMCFNESAPEENNSIISESVARELDETERQDNECYPKGGKLF